MASTASAKDESVNSGRAVEGAASGTGAGSTLQTAARLVRFAVGVNARAYAATVATAFAGSLAEGVGLVLLLPLLAAAGVNFSGTNAASRLAAGSQRLLAAMRVPHGLCLAAVLGLFLLVGALRGMLRRRQSMMVYTTTTRVQLALSRRVYAAVVKAQWGFLVRQRGGRFTHLLTEELRHVADATTLSLTILNMGCMTLLYLAVAVKLSAAMTLLVLLLGGALMVAQRGSLGRMRASGRELAESVGEVYAATEEHLLNLKSVKTYDAEDRDVALFAELCGEVARNAVGTARQQAVADFRFEVGSLMALAAAIYLALGVLHVAPATMLLLLAIFTRLMPQLATLQSQAHQFASILPSFDHVLAMEAECLAHAEPVEIADGEGVTASAPRLERELRLEDVWFAYQTGAGGDERNSTEFVLRGVTFPIEAGMLTAVIGPSGAGKSTIADLCNGLLVPTRGDLKLDERAMGPSDVRAWRRQVGYVGQETVLFHQSVRRNLLWAQPEATEADMREALERASAEFVYELPGGLESVVGDRGVLLSSGQRQRIALARALLRRPALLILDEATNALDVENEARILDAIREAIAESKARTNGVGGQPLTVLMIAHRASAIRRADRVFEMEAGRIARAGTREELQASALSEL
jgi:ATP-binding cassette subfamily C protein